MFEIKANVCLDELHNGDTQIEFGNVLDFCLKVSALSALLHYGTAVFPVFHCDKTIECFKRTYHLSVWFESITGVTHFTFHMVLSFISS